jgi:predicted house-cleaning noncanonical NTP pyrophosphatase (MazG superfamily)
MGYKLVRDNNKAWCLAHGVSGQWRTSEDPLGSIRRKLFEEAGEYAEYWETGELFDLLDVIQAAVKRAPSGTGHDRADVQELPETVTGLFGIVMAELGHYVTLIDTPALHGMQRAVLALISLQDPDGWHARAHHAKVAEMGGFTKFIEWCPVPAGSGAQ